MCACVCVKMCACMLANTQDTRQESMFHVKKKWYFTTQDTRRNHTNIQHTKQSTTKHTTHNTQHTQSHNTNIQHTPSQLIGLFCKRALLKRRYFAKETYHFKEPTIRSHPISSCTQTMLCNMGWLPLVGSLK